MRQAIHVPQHRLVCISSGQPVEALLVTIMVAWPGDRVDGSFLQGVQLLSSLNFSSYRKTFLLLIHTLMPIMTPLLVLER